MVQNFIYFSSINKQAIQYAFKLFRDTYFVLIYILIKFIFMKMRIQNEEVYSFRICKLYTNNLINKIITY